MKSVRCCRRLRTCCAESCPCIGHQDTEFIAPQPRENVGLAKTGAQNICGHDQRAVAFQVAVSVIDEFQIVQIQIDEQRRALALDHPQMLLGQGQESAPVV